MTSNGARKSRSSHSHEPAIQVICLGSAGGPSEENTTSLLVRSTAAKWAKGSVLAVDAGTHLSAITRILHNDFPLVSDRPSPAKSSSSDTGDDSSSAGDIHHGAQDDQTENSPTTSTRATSPDQTITTLANGPFAGLPFPFASARANAAHVMREYVSTYLITHPHLDHLSGLVINTAALQNTSRPKRVAALPFTVDSIKRHLFNDVIWPNLTDEDGGVGLVTFQRLQDGGNIALGEGYSSGYIEICDGLSVKGLKVSHGHCMRGPYHVHRGSNADLPDAASSSQRQANQGYANIPKSDPTRDARDARSLSFSIPSQPGTPTFFNPDSGAMRQHCIVDSSAYFIRASPSGREILVFGDVEPDSISLSPRNAQVWSEAAPKIAAGLLRALFIECSYNDSQSDAMLFGHLAPRHLIQELQVLAEMTAEARKDVERLAKQRPGHKRKRTSTTFPLSPAPQSPKHLADEEKRRTFPTLGMSTPTAGSGPPSNAGDEIVMPDAPPAIAISISAGETTERSEPPPPSEKPLRGLKVVVIHVKDTLTDGPLVGESILEQLRSHEDNLASQGKSLGCEFQISQCGGNYWF